MKPIEDTTVLIKGGLYFGKFRGLEFIHYNIYSHYELANDQLVHTPVVGLLPCECSVLAHCNHSLK